MTPHPEDKILLPCQSNNFSETEKHLQTGHYKAPTEICPNKNIHKRWAWQGQGPIPEILCLVTFWNLQRYCMLLSFLLSLRIMTTETNRN